MTFLKSSVLLILLFVFFSCSEEALGSKFNSGRIVIQYQDNVRDAHTKAGVANVKVTWFANGEEKSATTNEQGNIYIDNLQVGNYYFTYHIDGYAKVTRSVSISPNIRNNYGDLEELGNGDYRYTVAHVTNLHKGMYKVKTQLMINLGNNYRVPASDMDFKLTLNQSGSYDYGVITYEGKTDANGMLDLGETLLPSPRFQLVASKVIQNRTYMFDQNFYPSEYDATIVTSNYSNNSSLFITDNNLFDSYGNPVINFDVNGSAVISYSESIDTSHPNYLVDKTTIRLRDLFYNTYIDATVTWSNTDKTVTVKPDTFYNGNFRLQMPNLVSTKSNTLSSDNYDFFVGGIDAMKVNEIAFAKDTTTIDSLTTTLNFTWTTAPYARRYRIYTHHNSNPNPDDYYQLANVYVQNDRSRRFNTSYYVANRGGAGPRPFENAGTDIVTIRVIGYDKNEQEVTRQEFNYSRPNN